MATLTRPGVYVDETTFPTFAPASIGTAVAAFVGPTPRGPLTPTVINSWQEFTATYGGFEVAYPPSPLAIGVYSYFSGGGSGAVVIRVINRGAPPTGPSMASSTFNDADTPPSATLQVMAANPGVWGNNVYIDILPGTVVVAGVPQTFTMQVKYQGTQPVNTVERWENLTMVPGSTLQGSNNYAIDVVNSTFSGSKYIQLLDLFAAFGNTNLLSDQASSFEDGVSTLGWAPETNVTLSNMGVTGAPQGNYVMQMTATAAGVMTAITPTGANGTPVIAGKSYTLTASFQAVTTVSTSCVASIIWYDIDGAAIGSPVSSPALADTTTTWVQPTITGIAPSNAHYAAVQLSVTAAAADDEHYVDNITLMGQNPNNNPVPTTASVALSGGADGSPPTFPDTQATVSLLDQFPDQAFVLNLPGNSNPTDTGNAITYAQNRGDIFVVLDCPPQQTPQQMALYGQGLASTAQAAVYYPELMISDPYSPTVGRTRLIPPGGYVAGTYVSTDRTRGVQKAPAGLGASLQGVVGLGQALSNTDLGTLNQSNVNAIISVPNSGIVVWGTRTLSSYLTTRYVNVERTLIYLQTNFVAMTKFAVFEPNDYILWNQLTSVLSQFLTSFWQSGGLSGSSAASAFYIICNQSNNTVASIQAGIVNIEVGVALQRPAEFVVVQIGQWAGGQSVQILNG